MKNTNKFLNAAIVTAIANHAWPKLKIKQIRAQYAESR